MGSLPSLLWLVLSHQRMAPSLQCTPSRNLGNIPSFLPTLKYDYIYLIKKFSTSILSSTNLPLPNLGLYPFGCGPFLVTSLKVVSLVLSFLKFILSTVVNDLFETQTYLGLASSKSLQSFPLVTDQPQTL